MGLKTTLGDQELSVALFTSLFATMVTCHSPDGEQAKQQRLPDLES
jgi:hypothetical protein